MQTRTEAQGTMDTLEAIMLIEGDEAITHEDLVAAVQVLVDSGLAWQLQGFYGRLACALIDAGEVTDPRH